MRPAPGLLAAFIAVFGALSLGRAAEAQGESGARESREGDRRWQGRPGDRRRESRAGERRERDRRRENRFSRVRAPADGPPEAIGSYRAGCLQGGVALPPRGPGYKLMGAFRPRRFGHPELVSYIRDLGRAADREGLDPLRVGDLSQPRGGPAPSLHASHQNGLDADIYYAPVGPFRLERFPPIIDRRHGTSSKNFWQRGARILRLAASDPRVERIYVNPIIKRELCEMTRGRREAWLGVLQPWWGHHRHFHVQLRCPAGSTGCVARPDPAPGDRCEEVAWWFDKERRQERQALQREYRSHIGRGAQLPPACRGILAPARRRR